MTCSSAHRLLGQPPARTLASAAEQRIPPGLVQSDPNFMKAHHFHVLAIVWERSGDISLEAPNRLSTIVKSTVGTEEDFQRFTFVFEDGQWKWNG